MIWSVNWKGRMDFCAMLRTHFDTEKGTWKEKKAKKRFEESAWMTVKGHLSARVDVDLVDVDTHVSDSYVCCAVRVRRPRCQWLLQWIFHLWGKKKRKLWLVQWSFHLSRKRLTAKLCAEACTILRRAISHYAVILYCFLKIWDMKIIADVVYSCTNFRKFPVSQLWWFHYVDHKVNINYNVVTETFHISLAVGKIIQSKITAPTCRLSYQRFNKRYIPERLRWTSFELLKAQF